MSKEIIYPTGVELPDKDDPDPELEYRKIRLLWLRMVGPQVGLDVKSLVVGHLLYCVRDDSNLVTWSRRYFTPEDGINARLKLLERLAWEIEIPETPEPVGIILDNERRQITDQDGANLTSFGSIRDVYYRARGLITAIERANPTLSIAHSYYQDASRHFLGKSYSDFINTLKGQRSPIDHRRH